MVARPAEVLREEDNEEWRRVHGPVVGDEGNLAAGRHLPAPELVKNTARLLVGERIVMGSLVTGEEPQGTPGHLWLERQHLERRDQAVASEGRHIPRNARVGDGALRRTGYEHVQVAPGAPEPAREPVVADDDACGLVVALRALLPAPAHDLGQAQGP